MSWFKLWLYHLDIWLYQGGYTPYITQHSTNNMDVFDETSTTSDCNNTFSEEQKNHMLIARGVIGTLSMTLCLFAVILVLCMKKYKIFTYRLAIYQILSSLGLSAAQVLLLLLVNYMYNGDSSYYQNACESTAFLLEYLVWIKLFFTTCLLFLFFLIVHLKGFKKLEIGYVLISTLFPLLYTWIPFIRNSFGVSGTWCWIRDWKDDCTTEQYLQGIIELLYGPYFIFLAMIVVAVVVIMNVSTRRYKYKTPENEPLVETPEHNPTKTAIKGSLPLLAYPIIFIVLALFPLINRVYGPIRYNDTFGLALAYSITESSWGFFAGLALIIHIFMTYLEKKNNSNKETIKL